MSNVAKIRRQIEAVLRYLWVAVLATVLNIAIATVLLNYYGVDKFWSRAIGYASGIVIGFTLSRLYSFKDRTSSSARRESVKYLLVTGAAFCVTTLAQFSIDGILTFFFDVAPAVHDQALKFNRATGLKWFNREFIGTTGGIGVGFWVNFFGHKFLTFRKTNVLDRIRGKVVA